MNKLVHAWTEAGRRRMRRVGGTGKPSLGNLPMVNRQTIGTLRLVLTPGDTEYSTVGGIRRKERNQTIA